jgi:1-acyl-sn-glycerol-3-phosphate acyltransferase
LFYHRPEIKNKANLPKSGAVVLVGNHASYLDPIYIGALLERRVHFMAKQELFKNRFSSMFFNLVGSFAVDRDKPDLKTFKTAFKYLGQGEVVGLFPEGTIKSHNSFDEIKQGAAYLALKVKAEVVPVFIEGTKRAMKDISWIKPVKIRVWIGKPIHSTSLGTFKEQRINLSSKIQASLQELSEQVNKAT